MSHTNNTFLPSGRIDLGTGELALGPLDGRYASVTAPLTNYLSEAALNRDRIHVEVEWFIYLCEHEVLPGLSPLSEEQKKGLRAIVTDFNADSVAELAEIEAVTVHDVKAVEYYIGRRLEGLATWCRWFTLVAPPKTLTTSPTHWVSRTPLRTCGSPPLRS